MRFSGVVTPGDILIAVTVIISVFGAYNRLSNQVEKIATKYEPVYQWWDRHINNGNGKKVYGD